MNTYRSRRLIERMAQDAEFRAEYRRAADEVAQVDTVIRQLDARREEIGCSKAELARRIGRNASSVRRMFTSEANPELGTVAAMAVALNAHLVLRSNDEDDSPQLARVAAAAR